MGQDLQDKTTMDQKVAKIEKGQILGPNALPKCLSSWSWKAYKQADAFIHKISDLKMSS